MAQFGAPSLITRNTNDVQQVQMLALLTCTLAVQVPIMMVGGIVMAMREDLGLSWLLAVVVPALFLAVGVVVSQMVPSFREVQTRIDDVNRILREQISGIRVVRAFVREPRETERFAEANDGLTEVSIRAGRWMASMFPTVMLVVNLSSVAVIWFGGHRVDDGDMQVGALTAFLSYLMQILMSVMMGTFMLMQIPRSLGLRGPDHRGPRHRVERRPAGRRRQRDVDVHGHLDLEDVSFSYPGAEQPVLCDVDLSARPGQTVAIIGSTGAGKSTLLNLVPRLFDATSGTVRIDGVDVRDLDPEVLWSRIGLVPSGRSCSPAPSAATCCTASRTPPTRSSGTRSRWRRARDFVERMPEGLDAPIVQGGTNVSGGQRQRLAIARALVRRPEIYLFDDAFSALDLTTDARLRAALRPETRESTVVVVAQRVSTHPRRRPDPRARGRPGRRPRHPRRAARRQRDVPGDRRVPAHRGGGGMTTTTPPPPAAPKGGAAMKQTERIEAPMGGPGRGPMGGGQVGQKAMTFKPSAKRLVRRMGPERDRALLVIGLAVVSVFLLAYGPRLLGDATDLIFGAFLADRPVDFDAVRSVLLQGRRRLRRRARCWPGARATSSTTSSRGPCAGCAPTSRTRSTRCRWSTSTSSRAAS